MPSEIQYSEHPKIAYTSDWKTVAREPKAYDSLTLIVNYNLSIKFFLQKYWKHLVMAPTFKMRTRSIQWTLRSQNNLFGLMLLRKKYEFKTEFFILLKTRKTDEDLLI
jgi:hypothetical protein